MREPCWWRRSTGCFGDADDGPTPEEPRFPQRTTLLRKKMRREMLLSLARLADHVEELADLGSVEGMPLHVVEGAEPGVVAVGVRHEM